MKQAPGSVPINAMADRDWVAEAKPLIALLTALCEAHSPVGCEREVDEVIRHHLAPPAARLWQDAAGNMLAHLPGRAHDQPLHLTAHKDEIGLVVKRIEEDGRLRVTNLGGLHPWKCGEGPVDILADAGGVVPAALGFGSSHVSPESPIHAVRAGNKPLKWTDAYVDAKLAREELSARGVHVGSKIALGRSRKTPRLLGNYVCAHGLDDKGGVAILLQLADSLATEPPPQDVYFILASSEEVGSGAAAYATHMLPGAALIAVEVVPVMPEYGVANDERLVLVYKDAYNVYDEGLIQRAARLATDRELAYQQAVLDSFGSDASLARQAGAVPQVALFGFPTENTHGYEVAHLGGLLNCRRLLEAFVRAWPE